MHDPLQRMQRPNYFVISTRQSADMGQTGRTYKKQEKELVKTSTEAQTRSRCKEFFWTIAIGHRLAPRSPRFLLGQGHSFSDDSAAMCRNESLRHSITTRPVMEVAVATRRPFHPAHPVDLSSLT